MNHVKVLTLGLGLGYFAYMASQKVEVTAVTVVEQSKAVIGLFHKHILPQFPHKEKIRVVHADAYAYLDERLKAERYDIVFADLWHDVSDGLEQYRRIKRYELDAPDTRFQYWIEKSMRCYL